MGSDNFFTKLAAYDPIAQAFHLPGSQDYINYEQNKAAGGNQTTKYTGKAATLQDAAGGYANAGLTPLAQGPRSPYASGILGALNKPNSNFGGPGYFGPANNSNTGGTLSGGGI